MENQEKFAPSEGNSESSENQENAPEKNEARTEADPCKNCDKECTECPIGIAKFAKEQKRNKDLNDFWAETRGRKKRGGRSPRGH